MLFMAKRRPFPKPPIPLAGPELAKEVTKLAEVRRRYTVAEVRHQMTRVEELMTQGAGERQIYRVLTTASPTTGVVEFAGMSLAKVRQRMVAVSRLWAEEMDRDRGALQTKRAAAIRRSHEMRRWALAGERSADGRTWVRKPDAALALRIDIHIAKLEGTLAPIKVDVGMNVSGAMMAVMANMDDDTAQALLAEAQEQERLARAARRLLPGVIDVEAQVVTDPSGSVAKP